MSQPMYAVGMLISFAGGFMIALGLLNAILNKMTMDEIQTLVISGVILLVVGGIIAGLGKRPRS